MSCTGGRLKHVNSEALDEEIEETFNMQLEQMIKQCNDELGLIPKMIEWEPWDVPPDHKVGMHAIRKGWKAPKESHLLPTAEHLSRA